MNLADLKTLPEGTQLLTAAGTVTLVGVGRSCAVVRDDDGQTRECRAASLRPALDLHPLITAQRHGLTGHTITVERMDRAAARLQIGTVRDWRRLIGRRAVVERHDGRLGKVCCVAGADGISDDEIEPAAEGTARTYGARYVPAGS